MDSDQSLCWERIVIGSLFLLSVFWGSGKAVGIPANTAGAISPATLRQMVPVLKTVMLEVRTRSQQEENSGAASHKTVHPVTGEPLPEGRYRIKWGDTCWSIAQRYGLSLDELVRLNPGLNTEVIKSGEYIQVRKAGASNRGRSPTQPVSAPGLWEITLLAPVSGARLTSGYGMRGGSMHRGVDLAAVAGTPIRAAAAGRVAFAGWKSGYGLIVILDHGDFQTKYAHNSENLVRTGDLVERGTPIAKIGRTGNATGNHLHFELLIGGRPVNPLPYLK